VQYTSVRSNNLERSIGASFLYNDLRRGWASTIGAGKTTLHAFQTCGQLAAMQTAFGRATVQGAHMPEATNMPTGQRVDMVEAERSGAGIVTVLEADPAGLLAAWWNHRAAEATLLQQRTSAVSSPI
jgi:hypothetical protein